MKIYKILLCILFVCNTSIMATQPKVEELLEENPALSCSNISSLVQGATLGMGTKLSMNAAYYFPGYTGLAALGVGMVGTVGLSVFERYVAYDACVKIKKNWAKDGSK